MKDTSINRLETLTRPPNGVSIRAASGLLREAPSGTLREALDPWSEFSLDDTVPREEMLELFGRLGDDLEDGPRAEQRAEVDVEQGTELAAPTVPEPNEALTGTLGRAVSLAYIAAHGHPLEHDGRVAAHATRTRWALGTRAAIGLVATALLIIAVLAVRSFLNPQAKEHALQAAEVSALAGSAAEVTASKQANQAVDDLPEENTPVQGESSETEPQEALVVVQLAGAVKNPGVYELPSGSRVADGVKQAGGPTNKADESAINLARVLVDGEQIYLPEKGEATRQIATGNGSEASGGASNNSISSSSGIPRSSNGAGGGAININQATAEELDALPGVGPAIATRIVEWRESNGAFNAVADLQNVKGIGPSTLAKIADHATVG